MNAALVLIGIAGAGLWMTGASAQDISFEGEVSFLSDYVASGVSQTGNNPAVQFTGTASLDNAYVGIFASNVNFGHGTTDKAEIGVFAGYWHQFSTGLLVDVGYEHYFYNRTGSCCGVLYATASKYFGDQFWLEGTMKFDPRSRDIDTRMTAAFYATDALGLRVALGRSDAYSHVYGSVGADYSLTESVTTSIDYHKASSSVTRDKFVAGLMFSF